MIAFVYGVFCLLTVSDDLCLFIICDILSLFTLRCFSSLFITLVIVACDECNMCIFFVLPVPISKIFCVGLIDVVYNVFLYAVCRTHVLYRPV